MKKLIIPLSLFAYLASPAQNKPNIIFILCDDMGYGDLGCYGQKYISTPNLDNMAREGMRFTQAYAGSPVSAPSRATIMTGLGLEAIMKIGKTKRLLNMGTILIMLLWDKSHIRLTI